MKNDTDDNSAKYVVATGLQAINMLAGYRCHKGDCVFRPAKAPKIESFVVIGETNDGRGVIYPLETLERIGKTIDDLIKQLKPE